MKKECVAMLLAGGQGSRLKALTSHVAKPAVPFGGKYRIIDFPLSNCVNSGIDTVGVLTQYQPLELNAYLGNGQPWDLDRSDGGLHILPPYVKEGDAGTWYKGTANAIYQNMGFIELYDPDYVVILSGDHVYKMDYSDMLKRHKETGAACTIAVLEVSLDEASRFGIMNVDENDIIYEFEEKPKKPKSTLASMGIYIFTWAKLREYLIADEADPKSSNDFGKNVIPAMLGAGEIMAAYRFSGYRRTCGGLPLPGHRRLRDSGHGGKLCAFPLGHGGGGRHGALLYPDAGHGGQGRRHGGLCHRGGERCDRCRRYGRRAAGGRRGRLGHHGGRQRNQGGRPGHGPCPRHGHPQRQGC